MTAMKTAAILGLLGLVATTVLAVEDEVFGPPFFALTAPDPSVLARGKPPPADGTCENALWKRCQNDFAAKLAIDVAKFSDGEQLRKAIAGKYYRQKDLSKGIVSFCNKRRQFQQCLGVEYDSCVDPWLFMRRGSGINNSFALAGVYRFTQFDCDGGLMQLTTHWNQVWDLWANPTYNKGQQACVAAYNTAVNKDPTSYCAQGQVLADCLQALYTTTKSHNDLVWWECERVRSQFLLDGFCPTFECHIPQDTNTKNAQGMRYYANRAEAIGHGAFVSQSRVDFYHMVGLKNRLRKLKLQQQQQKPVA